MKQRDDIFSFEDLEVYVAARNLVKDIYILQRSFPKEEQYALCDQIRRAAISITANLAEGSGRTSLKEKVHFIEISFGSMTEVFCERQIACDLGYITKKQFDEFRPQFSDVAKMLSGLRNRFTSRMKEPVTRSVSPTAQLQQIVRR